MVSEGGDSMVHISRWVIWAILLVSLGIIWYANILGVWYVTFLVGIALTGLPVRGGVAAFLSASVSAAGWGLPLAWMSRTGHMHAAAAAVDGDGSWHETLVDGRRHHGAHWIAPRPRRYLARQGGTCTGVAVPKSA